METTVATKSFRREDDSIERWDWRVLERQMTNLEWERTFSRQAKDTFRIDNDVIQDR